MEIAKLQDGQLIYGTYEECEEYADKENTCVDRYFDHINPSTVYKNFKYIGNEMSNPYSVSVPFDYNQGKPPATLNDEGVNQDKW